MRFSILVLPWLLFASNAIMPLSVKAEDWPQFRGIDRNNRTPETGLFKTMLGDEAPPLDWTAEELGEGYASVSVVGGRIYTTGNFPNNQSAVAIDAKTGRRLWIQPLTNEQPKHGYEGSRSTPTVDGDRLYMVTSNGSIVCLAAADGKELWRRDFKDWDGNMMSGWGYSESPLVDGNAVICTPGGKKGQVVSLDKMSGRDIWQCVLPNYADETGTNGKPLKDGAGYSSPVISNGGGVKQYIQLVGRGLIGIRANDGKLLWRYSRVANATANIPTAVIQDDFVFTSTAYETGSALLKLVGKGSDEIDAQEVYWLNDRELQCKHGGLVLSDGHIYCGHGNGNGMPICVNMSTGKIAWGPERTRQGSGEAAVVYGDGHVVMRRDDGWVLLVKADPSKFQLVGSFKPAYQKGKSWAHPVISAGKLFLREQDKLMCYSIK